MTGPFARMDPVARRRLFGRSMVANVVFGGVMLAVAKPMRDNGSDIVPFEVAGTAEEVDRIIEGWGPDGVRAATLQTRLDMGYLVSYAVPTAAGCAIVADAARRSDHRLLAWIGGLLGWGAFVAAACDAVENASMLAELDGRRGALPVVARRCALVKFGILAAAVPYGLAALVVGRRGAAG